MKTFLSLAAIVVFAGAAFADGKTYSVRLNAPSQFGSVKLKAVEYKLKVDGTNAVFTEAGTKTTFTVPIKVENTTQKFEFTAVESSTSAGVERIDAIELGGAKIKIESTAHSAIAGN